MSLDFRETDPLQFFSILPEDWRESIVPLWKDYADNSKIYGYFKDGQMIVGGIVFSTCSPDMFYNCTEANLWLEKGYLYIGYVWVVEELRGKNWGSHWLQTLIAQNKKQKYWLTVEEEKLKGFYEKNGFKFVKTLQNNDATDWLMVYEPI